MVNLVKRKVGFSPIYSCKRELENTLHVLWGCENIKFVWCKDFCELNVENHPLDSFVDLSSLTLSNPKGAKLFAMICGLCGLGEIKLEWGYQLDLCLRFLVQ